ncbi:MAG: GNAT family N-acetyltransferase [Anaerolineae bacterium]|nr:GNAT family N-acetyltransferase [Anaerolineae bacterium]
MEPRDLPAVLAVDRMVFTDPWPESVYIQELYFNPKAYYFVLQLDKPEQAHKWWAWRTRSIPELLGFVGMRVELSKGHISTLAVRPGWHGFGFGEWLLLTALEQLIEDGSGSVTLEVRVSNYVAQNLYSKYKFKQVSRLSGYYRDGEDAFLLRTGPLDHGYQQLLSKRRALLMEKLKAWEKEEVNL